MGGGVLLNGPVSVDSVAKPVIPVREVVLARPHSTGRHGGQPGDRLERRTGWVRLQAPMQKRPPLVSHQGVPIVRVVGDDPGRIVANDADYWNALVRDERRP